MHLMLKLAAFLCFVLLAASAAAATNPEQIDQVAAGLIEEFRNRLYVVEPTFTTTGMTADHRLRLPATDIERYALALAKTLSEKFAVDVGPLKDAASKADACSRNAFACSRPS